MNVCINIYIYRKLNKKHIMFHRLYTFPSSWPGWTSWTPDTVNTSGGDQIDPERTGVPGTREGKFISDSIVSLWL